MSRNNNDWFTSAMGVPVAITNLTLSNTTTVSGVLTEDLVYSVSANADVWVYLDAGGREAVPQSEIFLAKGERWTFRTSAQHRVIGALTETTTSGIMSVAQMEQG